MKNVKQMTLAALFLALALILPFLTGQIPQIGSMLCPMHFPVLICGFVCGPIYGGIVGFASPLLRHLLFSMPPMPAGIAMAFELATYGFVAGFLYNKLSKTKINIFASLISAMIIGRGVWGIVRCVMAGMNSIPFGFEMFVAGAITQAIPGIVLQLILIPAIILTLRRAHLMD